MLISTLNIADYCILVIFFFQFLFLLRGALFEKLCLWLLGLLLFGSAFILRRCLPTILKTKSVLAIRLGLSLAISLFLVPSLQRAYQCFCGYFSRCNRS